MISDGMQRADPETVEYFKALLYWLRRALPSPRKSFNSHLPKSILLLAFNSRHEKKKRTNTPMVRSLRHRRARGRVGSGRSTKTWNRFSPSPPFPQERVGVRRAFAAYLPSPRFFPSSKGQGTVRLCVLFRNLTGVPRNPWNPVNSELMGYGEKR
jgi:hypothetical protein